MGIILRILNLLLFQLILLALLPSITEAKDGTEELSIPLVFRENIGQWDKDILYKGSSSSGNIFFTKKGMVVAHTRKVPSMVLGRDYELENLYWKVSFLGAKDNVQVRPAGQAASYTNYLIGESNKHKSNVPDFQELRYESIYNGIDLHYYSVKGELKYDFILSPNADINDIQLNLEGIKNIKLKTDGSLEVAHKWGTVIEKKPYSYQELNGKKVEVDIRYVLKGKHTYGYKAYGSYDSTKPIIIDPITLMWGTYVGGSDPTIGGYQYDIAVDRQGNTYGTGYYPGAFPTTSGSWNQLFNGGYGDVFVYKLSSDGSGLIYSTYVGGSDDDRGMAITVNGNGEAYVAGYTFTPPNGFPKSTQFGATASTKCAFVFKLNSGGSALIFSTYMGANNQEAALDLAVNGIGEVYVVGETKSFNFPMITTGYDNTYNGGAFDGFYVKLNATGSAMLASGFIGGIGSDRVSGIALDDNSNVYITGYTGSANFPVTGGVYDNTHNGGLDAFVMKFNSSMTTLQYSTFLGGSFDDEGLAIDVNPEGDAFITGYTFSNNYPQTNGANYSGVKDIILTRLNSSGSSILYSKLIGGGLNDEGTSLIVDTASYVYLTGISESTMPTKFSGPSILNGENNVFFGIYCKDGREFTKFVFGGAMDDYNKPSIGLKTKYRVCDVYIGFTTHSFDLGTTDNTFQKNKLNGTTDNDQPAVFKIMLSKDTTTEVPNPIVKLCNPMTATICVRDSVKMFCDEYASPLRCHTYIYPNPPFYSEPMNMGYSIINGCSTRVVAAPKFQYIDTVFAFIKKPLTICKGESKELYAIDKNGNPAPLFLQSVSVNYLWSTGATGPMTSISQGGTYWLRTTNYCGVVTSDTIVVKEIDKPTVDLGSDRTICFPITIMSNAANPADTIPTSYLWSPLGQSSSSISINRPGNYCVTKTNICGVANDCIMINPLYAPTVDLGNDTSICNGAPVTLDAGPTGNVYLWSPGGQTTQTISVSTPGTYSVTVINACGTVTDQIDVGLVTSPPDVNLGPDLLLCSPSDFPRLLDAQNPGSNYYWSDGSSNQTLSIIEGGEYSVLVTNGCGTDQDNIIITAPPSLGLALGPDTVLCSPASVLLDAENTGATYLWTPGGQTTQTINATSTGNYAVTVTNACGSASDNINVLIQPGLPVVNLGPNQSICIGSPTILSVAAAPGQTYLWSTGATTSSISVSTTGTYWVEVKNSCGTVRDEIELTDGAPSFSLGPDRYVCAPTTVSLSASGAGNSFLWSTGSTSSSISVPSTGTYWVDVTNLCGTVRDEIFVSIATAAPIVNLGPDQTQCAAFSINLNAGNFGSTYLWSPNNQTTQTITVTAPGLYSVTATNGCGTSQDNILIISQPLLSFGIDTFICQGNSITLDAGNIGATYLWTPGGQTSQTITVNSAGTYGVTISNSCGTINDEVVIGILTAAPTVNLGPDIRACAPLNIVLDAGASAGSVYLWSTGETTQTINVSTSGIYSVQVSNSCGNAFDAVSIIVDAGLPVVNLGSDQLLCNPIFLSLDAGIGAASYLWNNGSTISSIFVTSSGTYEVTATNSCGSASDEVVINGLNPPTGTLRDTGACASPILLEANNNADVNFLWTPAGQTTQSIIVSSSGTYGILMSNICGVVSNSIEVIINTTVPSFSLGNDTNLCTPSGLILDAGLHLGGNYNWTPGSDTTRTKLVTQQGIYSATVTNYCGATTDDIIIAANPILIDAKYADTICPGNSIRLYTDSLSGYTYDWSPSVSLIDAQSPSPLATPDNSTTYYITTSNGLCWNSDSVRIEVDTLVNPDIVIFPPSGQGYVPLNITFSDRNDIGYSYVWNFDDGDTSHLKTPTHTFEEENYYFVTLTTISPNGCEAKDSVRIKAIKLFIPNLITPNGDGLNDKWVLTGLHDQLYVEIFNRWGDRVYAQSNYIDQWTGEGLSDGIYYFLVEDGIYGKSYKGWVQLLRNSTDK